MLPGGADALTPEALLVSMRDSNISNMIVAFLRLATSAEIGARSDFFCPFVMVRSIGHRSTWVCRGRMHETACHHQSVGNASAHGAVRADFIAAPANLCQAMAMLPWQDVTVASARH